MSEYKVKEYQDSNMVAVEGADQIEGSGLDPDTSLAIFQTADDQPGIPDVSAIMSKHGGLSRMVGAFKDSDRVVVGSGNGDDEVKLEMRSERISDAVYGAVDRAMDDGVITGEEILNLNQVREAVTVAAKGGFSSEEEAQIEGLAESVAPGEGGHGLPASTKPSEIENSL